MKPKLKIEGNRAVIHGALTIKYHKEFFQLVRKLEAPEVREVIIDHPTEIDLSAIQMLWLLEVLKRKKMEPVTITFNLNDTDRSLMKRCGFSHVVTPIH